MTLQIYKFTMFIICVSIGIQFIELSGIVPDTHTGYADDYTNSGIFGKLTSMVSYMFDNTVPSDITYGTLLLATFSLLVLSLPFILALFWFGYILTADVILKLPLDSGLQAGLILLLAITYMVGYQQYKSTTIPTLER